MIRRRSLLAGAALVVTGCAVAAKPGSRAEAAELVWATGEITANSSAADVAAMWNRQHPQGPHVRVEALPVAADDQHDIMAVELNAGLRGLDILDVDLVWTGEFAEAGWLVELEDLRPEIEHVSLPRPVQSAVWNGNLWAAPFTTDVGLLYYRTDLLDRPPATWPELKDLGLRVGAEQGIAPFVADGRQYEGLVVQYLEYLWAAGGELFSSPDCSTVLFGGKPAMTAAEFMRTARRDGFYAPGFDTMGLEDARRVFQAGQAVFLRSWPYAYRQMNQDPESRVAGKVGIAPLPTFDGQGTAAALGGHNLAVSRFSTHIDAAKEFVRFVSTSPEVQRRLAQQHSLAPTMKAVYQDLADDPLMAELNRVLPEANPRPSTPDWAIMSEEIQQQIFAAYTDKKNPQTAIEEIRAFLDATETRC